MANIDLFDTHCHIHFDDYGLDPDAVIENGKKAGVKGAICVGTTLKDSQRAIDFVNKREGMRASIGIHPHEAQRYYDNHELLTEFTNLVSRPKVIAVGECGLDYFYTHSPKKAQEQLLREQIELALGNNLPIIFHVRDAFDAFWKIFDEYKGISGVVHSFTATQKELDEILARDLYVGLNGITTFMKNDDQLNAVKAVPLDKLVLETDAPFLTPTPYRGTICQLMHVRVTADFLAKLRGENIEELAATTTSNSMKLFKLEEKNNV